MDLKYKVRRFISEQQLIAPGSTLILGISGGPDSVALAHIMHGLRHEMSLSLHMAHFNHCLRPEASGDQKFVEALGDRLQMPVVIGVRTKSKAPLKGVSEDAARKWRLAFFERTARRLKIHTVVLAHTQNDAAETVLMRLVRGSGLYGLRSILPARQVGNLKLVRPLLEVNREEVMAYLKANGLKFRTDQTNRNKAYMRNKVRLDLLPLLAKEYNPNIYRALADLAASAADDYDFLQQVLRQRIKEKIAASKTSFKIPFAFIVAQPPAVQRLLMRLAFEHLTGGLKELTFEHIEQVRHLLRFGPAGTVCHWPKGVFAVRHNTSIEFKHAR